MSKKQEAEKIYKAAITQAWDDYMEAMTKAAIELAKTLGEEAEG